MILVHLSRLSAWVRNLSTAWAVWLRSIHRCKSTQPMNCLYWPQEFNPSPDLQQGKQASKHRSLHPTTVLWAVHSNLAKRKWRSRCHYLRLINSAVLVYVLCYLPRNAHKNNALRTRRITRKHSRKAAITLNHDILHAWSPPPFSSITYSGTCLAELIE